ncbi:MAG: MBL fold metallo-hydrolase [Chloroflexi bacterium]|nr:MBL fold metallo-hydrolase [Chloroflexota bacterium]
MSPNIHQFAIPTPFMVGPVNVYLLEGDPLTLIDVGPNSPEAYDALVAALAQLGYTLPDIQQVVITHHHVDHLGQVARIMEESGAKLAAHPQTREFLEDPTTARERHGHFSQVVFQEAAVPEEIIQAVNRSYKFLQRYSNPAVAVSRMVDEGDMVQAGGIEWRVYHTPGHSGDLICLYHADSQTLMASDHIILKISSNPLIEPAAIEGQPRPHRLLEYISQLQRIAALDIQLAYSGHGAPVEDVRGLVEKRIEFHHKRAAQILNFFEGHAYHLWDLTEKMFAHVPPAEKYLALSEVLGHIDLLEQDGKLTRIYREGVVYWQPVTEALHQP